MPCKNAGHFSCMCPALLISVYTVHYIIKKCAISPIHVFFYINLQQFFNKKINPMEQEEKSFLEAFEEKKIPGILNTLTILTFIGSGLELIGAIASCAFAKFSYDTADKYLNQGNPDNLPSSVGKAYTAETFDVLTKSYQYRIPILIFGLIATTLCVIGAIRMRSRKADGFWAWIAGEILPYFSLFFFIGTGAFAKPISWLFFLIPITFITLYASQRKHLS